MRVTALSAFFVFLNILQNRNLEKPKRIETRETGNRGFQLEPNWGFPEIVGLLQIVARGSNPLGREAAVEKWVRAWVRDESIVTDGHGSEFTSSSIGPTRTT